MHIPLFTNLATSLLPLLSPSQPSSSSSTITIRPIHAHTHKYNNTTPTLYFHNTSSEASFYAHDYPLSIFAADADIPSLSADDLTIRTVKTIIRRPRVRPPSMLSWSLSHKATTRRGGIIPFGTYNSSEDVGMWVAPDMNSQGGEWDDVEVIAPDIKDRQTLITLAKITSNAYVLPDSGEWWPVGKWNNHTVPFGWEDNADGLRGHIFADPKNETVIISIKGTSAGVLGSGGPTAKNDKFNDNLLFSCCCARVDFSWTPVCDCYAGGWRCEQTCLEDSLVNESVYATVGTNLYNNVTYMYPDATIWLVGHSLGGSLSAMVGLSFGAPAVTFEAPGDKLASKRLHLPLPPGMPADKTGITHVYHTADPIPIGACNGAYSGCYAAGFALESKCHTGQTILYDTVTVKGWSVDIRTHRITDIIEKVLADPWPETDKPKKPSTQPFHISNLGLGQWWGWGRKGPQPGKGGDHDSDGDEDADDGGWEKHGGVPIAEAEDDCVDCYRWEFGDGWNKDPKKSEAQDGLSIAEARRKGLKRS
ncbi:lipase [Kwoniella mangroviensis CBS 8886]|nr:lipase [Kwoniella mangroviensis CBS 8886]